MKNFNSPYFSTSVRQFWKRWHISLSLWFRDYVYIPMGGNRKGNIRKYINILITFLLSGLWHGANMTFVLWGGIHGCAQIAEDIFKIDRKKNWLSIAAVFLFVTFAWIFFRVETLPEAIFIFQNIFSGISHPAAYIKTGLSQMGIGKFTCAQIAISLLILTIFELIHLKKDPIQEISKLYKPIRWGAYWLFILTIGYYCIKNVGQNQFVYFQF